MRRAVMVVLSVVLAAVLIDRVALHAWNHRVLTFYRELHDSLHSTSEKATSITDMTWGDMLWACTTTWLRPEVGSETRPEVGFEKSGVRPDHVRVDDSGALRLFYLPPALAWTTRVFPRYSGSGQRPKSYRPLDHYQYEIRFSCSSDAGTPVVEIFRGWDREPVPVAGVNPGVSR